MNDLLESTDSKSFDMTHVLAVIEFLELQSALAATTWAVPNCCVAVVAIITLHKRLRRGTSCKSHVLNFKNYPARRHFIVFAAGTKSETCNFAKFDV